MNSREAELVLLCVCVRWGKGNVGGGGEGQKERSQRARANSRTRAEEERGRGERGTNDQGGGGGRSKEEGGRRRGAEISQQKERGREAEKCSAAEEVGEAQGIALLTLDFLFLRQNLFVLVCVFVRRTRFSAKERGRRGVQSIRILFIFRCLLLWP